MSNLVNLGDCRTFHKLLVPSRPPKRWQYEVLECLEGVVLARWRKEIGVGHNSVVIASRQVGKNEIKARFELRLASLLQRSPKKATALCFAPTRSPQLVINKDRLKELIEDSLYLKHILKPQWHEWYQMRADKFMLGLLSAANDANTAGHTATVVLETDETQDIQKSTYTKTIQPMAASTGAPSIHFGTEWDEASLLHEARLIAEERQRKLGIKLAHIIPWWREAEENPDYGDYVRGLIEEMGEDHLMIRTQFCCEPAEAAGNLLTSRDVESTIGNHQRSFSPFGGRFYVAGVDWCAVRETNTKESQESDVDYQGRDSGVVTIAECTYMWNPHNNTKMPVLRVVDHLAFLGREPYGLVDEVYQYLFDQWGCIKVCSDNTGVGNGPTQMLLERRRGAVIPFDTTYHAKSQLGHHLVGAIKSGRIKMYRDDGSAEWKECLKQLKECRRHELREGGNMKWGHPKTKVNGESIHDDFVLSMAYCYEAAKRHLAACHDPNAGNLDSLFERQYNNQELEDGLD